MHFSGCSALTLCIRSWSVHISKILIFFILKTHPYLDQITGPMIEWTYLSFLSVISQPNTHDHDMALALNRYICNSVLPLLTRNAVMFENADKSAALMDAVLHTVYRMASCRSLTRGQRDTIAEFLIALTKYDSFFLMFNCHLWCLHSAIYLLKLSQERYCFLSIIFTIKLTF